MHQKSLEIQVKVGGNDHIDVAKSCINIGKVYLVQDKEALESYKKSLYIQIKEVGHET